MFDAEKIINGSHGELWLDGEKVSEVKGFEARLEFEKQDVAQAGGKFTTGTKFMGYKGTGTMRIYKVNSRMIKKIGDKIKQGINPRFLILSSLTDPAADGAERIIIKDACFNDLVLANWEAKQLGEVEVPFTFTDYDYPDTIAPRD